jgi:hypothetical protein
VQPSIFFLLCFCVPVVFSLFLFVDLFTVASPCFHSSWEQFPAIAWAALSFDFPQNMSETNNGQNVAAAAATQVKLCPYDEEPAIWFLSSRHSLPGRESSRKNSVTPMLWPSAQASSLGHFRHSRCLQ